MTDILMSIGTNYFFIPAPDQETPAFETVRREHTATWTAQPRLGRDNANQFTGPGEETLEIHGRLFPGTFGGLDTMQTLASDLRAGIPLPVVAFTPLAGSSVGGIPLGYQGVPVGNYAIRKLAKENSRFDHGGTPRKVDFALDLCLYGDDLSTGSFSLTDTSAAPPTTSTTPTPTTTDPGGGTSIDMFPTSGATPATAASA